MELLALIALAWVILPVVAFVIAAAVRARMSRLEADAERVGERLERLERELRDLRRRRRAIVASLRSDAVTLFGPDAMTLLGRSG